MGWLAPYHVERNYCLYAYLDHQDRALQDPDYRYVFSEIPHLITMLERRPERFAELQGLVKAGQVEMVNAFVLEPTINLSGGEALVMQGVEGLRWYEQVMGLRPRHCWMIDITGWHEQMAQIVHGLGLSTFVYSRYNPTGSAESRSGTSPDMESIHWLESPDGTRTLAVNPGHYSEAFRPLMRARSALPAEEVVQEIAATIELQKGRFPADAPLLAFTGQEDYSLSYLYSGYPKELLEVWNNTKPEVEVRHSTLSAWYDEFIPGVDGHKLTTIKSGSHIYGWTGFWVNAPAAKQWYRRCEHQLQAAEALTTIASLAHGGDYPSQDFSNSWLLMALNMDRALLWCVAVEGVWSHPRSWDTKDRFETVEALSRTHGEIAARSIGKAGASIAMFNPANWKRSALIELVLPVGKKPRDAPAQLLEDGKTALVRVELPPLAVRNLALSDGAVASSRPARLPDAIETGFYTARIDPKTAALVSLKLKPSGREILGGPANVIAADERNQKDAQQVFAHEIPRKPDRVPVLTSSEKQSTVKYLSGPLASIVEAVCPFRGGSLRRVIRFHFDSPRIDFLTETADLPHGTIVTAAFPLAGEITEIRRAIPYGFAHCAWSRPNPDLPGLHNGILPVIRWSHYSLAGGGGAALLDRGVPAREVVENTAYVILHNATHVYYWDNAARWMSGEGTQRFEYALVAHDSAWPSARIPHMAWEYNAAPLLFPAMEAPSAAPYLETSDNLIVEALRRTGGEIEIRAVECFGVTAEARIQINLPHTEAAMTNLVGQERRALSPASKSDAGAEYRFEVRPQQIVTLRLKTGSGVAPVKALRTFDPVVPEHKRAATRGFDHPELKGHPPREGEPEWKKFDV